MTRPLPQPVRVYRVGGSVRDELLGRAAATATGSSSAQRRK